MTDKEKLEAMLEESNSYYIRNGEGWLAYRDGIEVEISIPEDGVMRALAHTKTFANDENKAAMVALTGHLSGWLHKVGTLELADDGEVLIYLDRSIDDEAPDHMVTCVSMCYDQDIAPLRAIEQGESPSEAIKRSGDPMQALGLLRALRESLAD
ncbi:Uncharacterised protein [Slackia heliotrinireducens]|uniref:Uncharacterized protein n=1 Tax=Slackia heliotrinireducens (strain ATCC 29202 / DSM 20476 / NCTC 11029 / RHS 1) TaxID=471855 RepID=C7N1N7_SLAHD|nr:hypothetical protein [Slackia heliotrinireducens]ACV21329.1 hypothetical protein Shel_02610 [Slackia heliotrinireducens DSM 20476]VEG98764.1 Uncharacterised protein [Slackia heliotrinireducens]